MAANVSGNYNVAVGQLALDANTTASSNTAVGYASLTANTTGTYNSCFGQNALLATTTGSYNVASARGGEALTTGAGNICLGYQANTPANDTDYAIVMGYQVTGVGGSNFTFGYGGTDSNIAFGATTITAPSDGRYKEEIADATAGLSFINDLRPVTFKWKKEKDLPSDHRAYVEDSETRTMNDYTNHGFIAQEVKTAIDAHSEIKDGFEMWQADETDGRQRLGPSALVPMLVKAIQEQNALIEALTSRITTLEG
jgi:hypothetical protein